MGERRFAWLALEFDSGGVTGLLVRAAPELLSKLLSELSFALARLPPLMVVWPLTFLTLFGAGSYL